LTRLIKGSQLIEYVLISATAKKLEVNACAVCWLGMTASEMVGTWKREAEKALGLRCSGTFELDLFKVVAQREVRCWRCSVSQSIKL